MDFDDSQSKCIKSSVKQPLIILAGPGSGKTRTLIGRICFLLNDNQVPSNEILTLCFSRKASHEVQDRVVKSLSVQKFNIGQLTVKTFHSFCLRVLRDNANRVKGLNKKFTLITSKNQRVLIRKLLSEGLEGDSKVENEIVTKWVNKISRVKCMGGNENEEEEKDEFIEKYNHALRQKNGLDFADLIIETGKLFEENEDVLDEYRDRYKYVLCDEFQDLNRIQYRILTQLSSKSGQITVVGDEDQSIYGFRGGTSKLFGEFRKDFPQPVNEYVLEQNYRSTNIIVSASKQVIERNDNRTKKTLFSIREKGAKIRVMLMSDVDHEVEFIVSELVRLKRKNEKFNDIAILCRQRKNVLKVFEEAIKRKNIPLLKSDKRGINERIVSSTILSYLCLIINKTDDDAFLEIYNVPKRKLGGSFQEYIQDYRDELSREKKDSKRISLYDACKIGFDRKFPKTKNLNKPPNKTSKKNLKKFIKMIRQFRKEVENMELYEFIAHTVSQIDLETAMNKQKKSESKVREYQKIRLKRAGKNLNKTEELETDEDFEFNFNLQENLYSIQKIVNKFNEQQHSSSTIRKKTQMEKLKCFIDYVRTMERGDENIEQKDAVFCSTIHQAKGLEWKHVYIVRSNEGITPSQFASKTAEGYEEERRLFYVAMSRAKDFLTISCLHNEDNYPTSYLNSIDPNIMELHKHKKYIQPREVYKFTGKQLENSLPIENQQRPKFQTFNSNQFASRRNQFIAPRQQQQQQKQQFQSFRGNPTKNRNFPMRQQQQNFSNQRYGGGNERKTPNTQISKRSSDTTKSNFSSRFRNLGKNINVPIPKQDFSLSKDNNNANKRSNSNNRDDNKQSGYMSSSTPMMMNNPFENNNLPPPHPPPPKRSVNNNRNYQPQTQQNIRPKAPITSTIQKKPITTSGQKTKFDFSNTTKMMTSIGNSSTITTKRNDDEPIKFSFVPLISNPTFSMGREGNIPPNPIIESKRKKRMDNPFNQQPILNENQRNIGVRPIGLSNPKPLFNQVNNNSNSRYVQKKPLLPPQKRTGVVDRKFNQFQLKNVNESPPKKNKRFNISNKNQFNENRLTNGVNKFGEDFERFGNIDNRRVQRPIKMNNRYPAVNEQSMIPPKGNPEKETQPPEKEFQFLPLISLGGGSKNNDDSKQTLDNPFGFAFGGGNNNNGGKKRYDFGKAGRKESFVNSSSSQQPMVMKDNPPIFNPRNEQHERKRNDISSHNEGGRRKMDIFQKFKNPIVDDTQRRTKSLFDDDESSGQSDAISTQLFTQRNDLNSQISPLFSQMGRGVKRNHWEMGDEEDEDEPELKKHRY